MKKRIERKKMKGFTIIELLVVIVVISILAAIVTTSYSGIQRRATSILIQQTVSDAEKNLYAYYAMNDYYPQNIADTEYAPPLSVAVVLYNNAPQIPQYMNLTSSQNAQLFLNACNGHMPITNGIHTYNTSCVFSGNNFHIKGQEAANVVLHGPLINQEDIVITCGSACTAAQNSIITAFLQQGGEFPVTVPKNGSALPAPTNYTTIGPATMFCVEGRSPLYNDLLYHATPSEGMSTGPCSLGTDLHYP